MRYFCENFFSRMRRSPAILFHQVLFFCGTGNHYVLLIISLGVGNLKKRTEGALVESLILLCEQTSRPPFWAVKVATFVCLFLKLFLSCGAFLKSLFVTILHLFYVLVFWPWGTWDPWPGIKPHALEGKVLITGLPGKSLEDYFWKIHSISHPHHGCLSSLLKSLDFVVIVVTVIVWKSQEPWRAWYTTRTRIRTEIFL